MKNEDLPWINLRIYDGISRMSGISRISRENKKQIEDEVTDHKYHTHSNEQFPLATKT